MRRITEKITQALYTYEKTTTINRKLNSLIFISVKNKITFAKKSLQVCMIKNKILPFFACLPKKQKLRPIFYSNNLQSFVFLRKISQLCYGTCVAGKWEHGFILNDRKWKMRLSKLKKAYKNNPVRNKNKSWATYEKEINAGFFKKKLYMLVVTNARFCQAAIKEAKNHKFVSLGCVNFGDKSITNLTYFIIGPKNNLSFSEKFCLIISYIIKWKTYVYGRRKKEFFIALKKRKKRLRKLKAKVKSIREYERYTRSIRKKLKKQALLERVMGYKPEKKKHEELLKKKLIKREKKKKLKQLLRKRAKEEKMKNNFLKK